MQLAPRNPGLPFIAVQPLPDKAGAAPKLAELRYDQAPKDTSGLVSIRYRGTDARGTVHQLTERNHPEFTGEKWYRVSGSFDDAVRAARELAVVDGYEDLPAKGGFARTSVAVLAASDGAWDLMRMAYTEGTGDGMDAIISMPIDTAVAASRSEVSVPYGSASRAGFDRPDKGVFVRFDDPRVAALVGLDSIAVAPKR